MARKRADTLDSPMAKHTDGKKTAYGTNGMVQKILDSGLVFSIATPEYIESWKRDAERIAAERKVQGKTT